MLLMPLRQILADYCETDPIEWWVGFFMFVIFLLSQEKAA